MAVKASGSITLAAVTDVSAVTPYYKAQTSTLSPPSKPTSVPPSGWSATQPAVDTSNTCYIVWLMEYSNGTWGYSDVSTFSEYEAAKAAQATASSALATAQSTEQHFWFTGTGEDAGAHITKVPKAEFLSNPEAAGGNSLITSNGMQVRDGTEVLAEFASDGIQMKNATGLSVLDIDSASDLTSIHITEGPLSDEQGGQQHTLSNKPMTGTSIVMYVVIDATRLIFNCTAGTAYTTSGSVTTANTNYTVTYDGDRTFAITLSKASVYCFFQYIYYDTYSYQPILTYGTSKGLRGGFSATLGEGLEAPSDNQVAVGMYNDAIGSDFFEVGVGTDDDNRKTMFAVSGDGVYCGSNAEVNGQVHAAGGFYAENPSSVTFTGTRSNAIYRGECFGTYDYATGFVTLIFHFYHTSDIPTSYTLFTIPSQFRPSTTRYGAAFYTVGSSWISYHCYVTNGGIVRQDVSGSTRSGFGVIKYILD